MAVYPAENQSSFIGAVMKQGAFAALCGISKQMVSKYAQRGHLALDGSGEIDAVSSLVMLEGRLHEAKRQQALGFMAALQSCQPKAGGADLPTRRGAKVEREEIERDLKALQLGREVSALVLKDDVDAAGREAFVTMRKTFGNAGSEMAARICAGFGVPSDKSSALARVLSREFAPALGAFARELGVADGADA